VQVEPQVLTALHTLARAATAASAEERLEQILDRQADEVAEVDRARPAVALEGGVAVAVVHASLLGVREDLVCLGGLLEALGRLGGAVAVRVVLEGQATVGLLDVVVGAGARDAEDFVVVALRGARHVS